MHMSEMIIENQCVVSVYYRGTLTNTGKEFHNNQSGDPFEFIVGFQQMLPGFEAALMGKSAGEKMTFNLSPEQAYGVHNPEAVKAVPLSYLPNGIQVGDQLALQTPEGQTLRLRVREINKDSAMLDMNHDLAGEELTFEVEIIEVREATAREQSRGMTNGQMASANNDCCKSGTCSI